MLEMIDELKITFLDFDGVLNVMSQDHDIYGSIFHQHLTENFKQLVDETNTKIVASSSWRKNGLDEMKAMWVERGLAGEIIDVTPSLYLQKNGSIQFWNNKMSRHPTEKISGYSIPRGCEIDYWLKNESKNFGKVSSYVIIDDDCDFLFTQRNNFVQCSNNFSHVDNVEGYGLTTECTKMAINILNKK